jgi:hypothetical protein
VLRLLFLCALVALGVGLTMELSTPVRSAVAVIKPAAETTAGISDSADAMAKADRLEIAAASSKAPTQPALVAERKSSSEGISINSSKPTRVINRQRTEPASKRVAIAVRPKSKPRATDIKRPTINERKVANNTELCRLSACGGLRKALNIFGCEI